MQTQQTQRRGAAATELAILLPFLLLMLFAVIDFGRIYHVTQTLSHSAHAGAILASATAQSPSSVSRAQSAVEIVCANGVGLNKPLRAENVKVVEDTSSGTVTVQVGYEFELITPVLGHLGPIWLERRATLRVAPTAGS